MKRPTWVTIVGIMGIVFGCFGILGNGQMMIMPKMLKLQKKIWSGMKESFEKQEAKRPQSGPPKAMLEAMEDMCDVPPWFGTYCVVAGIVSLLVSGFYVFASIQLLQTKSAAIKLFYSALGLDIGFTILKAGVAVASMSFMGMAMMMGGMFGVVVSVVMLVVVATGDKTAFTAPVKREC